MEFELEGDTLIGYEEEPRVTQAVIPYNVRTIAARAFNQSSITSVVIPDSVEYITGDAFYCCENLVKVTLPEKEIAIEYDAFFRCGRFTANLSISDWDPLFGMQKALYARNYMNNYNANDPHYELYHEVNSRYIRTHLGKIIRTLSSSDTGVVVYLTREKMLGLNHTNRLLDIMSGNIEATAILLEYKHKTFPKEYLERYERENTEKELGLRKRSFAEWRKIFKLVSDGSGGWSIGRYRGMDSLVVIPEKIGNKPVTGILSNAFGSFENQCHIIEEIILPDTITVIENGAFEFCYNLKSITLSSNLRKIGDSAFYSTGLTSITIPDSVTHIEDFTFYDCTALEKVVLPDNLKKIGSHVFSGCVSLTSITLPETLSEIGNNAFKGCKSLTEIEIPGNITRIPEFMFSKCLSLKKVTLADSLRSIDKCAFNECQSLTSINIPDRVTKISEYAFAKCSSLTAVTLPDSLLTLGGFAFSGCTQLADITVPQGVESFGNYCFEDTPWLNNQTDDFVICGKGVLLKYNGSDSEVTIPAGVTTIGYAAFKDNENITGVAIPEGVSEILRATFSNCSKLTHVTLPQGLKKIGVYAFCKTALCEITIPEGVTIIDPWAFSESSLRSVTIPQSVQVIGEQAFWNCAKLAEVNLPENLPTIRSYVFDNTPYLENLPGDFIMFGDMLYRYKGKSKMAIVPDEVTEIAEGAFSNCFNLELIVLPDTLKKLGDLFDPYNYNKTFKIRYKGKIYERDGLTELYNIINTQDRK